MMEASKSNWLGREVADIEVDCFLPRHWIKTSYFNTKPFFLPFLSFTLTLAWKDNTIIQISEIIAKRGVGKLCLSYFWICHKKFLSIHEQYHLSSGSGLYSNRIYLCGGYHSPWGYECLDSWHTAGQCLLGHLTIPLNFHNFHISLVDPPEFTPLGYKRPTTMNSNWDLILIPNCRFTSFGRDILPRLGININKNMIRNLSLTSKILQNLLLR